MGIRHSLITMAAEEGPEAIRAAERLQLSLETLAEIGDSTERQAACRLLAQVQESIKYMLDTACAMAGEDVPLGTKLDLV